MDKDKVLDLALEQLMNDMDDIEGHSAMSHSLEECPDPMNCNMHDNETGSSLAPEEGSPAAVEVTVHKMDGMPSLDGKKAEEGLTPEEQEKLRELVK